MPATVREIVDDAIEYTGQIAGAGVEMYAEDRFMSAVVRGFDKLFKKRKWEQYRKWYRPTLDGTLGIVSTDIFDKVRDFDDFVAVFRDTETRPLATFPMGKNPYSQAFTTGSNVLYWTSLHNQDTNYAKRKLQFYPITATNILNICAVEYPLDAIAENWDWQDLMYLDRALLMYMGTYELLAGDDLNAQAAATAQGEAQTRYKDIISSLSDHIVPISGASGVPTEWRVAP